MSKQLWLNFLQPIPQVCDDTPLFKVARYKVRMRMGVKIGVHKILPYVALQRSANTCQKVSSLDSPTKVRPDSWTHVRVADMEMFRSTSSDSRLSFSIGAPLKPLKDIDLAENFPLELRNLHFWRIT